MCTNQKIETRKHKKLLIYGKKQGKLASVWEKKKKIAKPISRKLPQRDPTRTRITENQ